MKEELLVEGIRKAVVEMTKEDLENADKPLFEFSKEHEEKMGKLIKDIYDSEDSNG